MKFKVFVMSVILCSSQAWAWTQLKCANFSLGSFVIDKVSNPRNQAVALLSEVKGDAEFGGVWLFENLDGRVIDEDHKMIYKTMNGSTLTVSTFRASCGRGSCELPRPLLYAAQFSGLNGQNIHYNCK